VATPTLAVSVIPPQVATLEHDGGLEDKRGAAQRVIVEHPGGLVAADRLSQRRVMVLVVEAASLVQSTVNLDRIACGHITSVLDGWGGELECQPTRCVRFATPAWRLPAASRARTWSV
jgi:hypothetical protein